MSLKEEIRKIPGFWQQKGPHNDIVLSSRVRIARNLRSVPFPDKLDIDEFNLIKGVVNKFMSSSIYFDRVELVDLNHCTSSEKRFLRERNLISSDMELADNAFVLLDKKGEFAIFVNDIDHFRIQVINSGLDFEKAYRIADKIDDELNKFAPYAFSEEYGYLSAKPSSVGTGVKISTIVHLPALSIHGEIDEIVHQAVLDNIEIKGDEDNANMHGYFFQISSNLLFGFSEIDIIDHLDNFIHKILDKEMEARELLVNESSLEIEDLVHRALGILSSARKISYREALKYLSTVRLGVYLGMVRHIDFPDVDDLLVNLQWAHLKQNYKKTFTTVLDSDRVRADHIRDKIKVL